MKRNFIKSFQIGLFGGLFCKIPSTLTTADVLGMEMIITLIEI